MTRIKKGLDLPITGEPERAIYEGLKVHRVAVIGSDFNGVKPKMLVRIGDDVKLGQPVIQDKETGAYFTSPGAGKVVEVNRGLKRVFQSLVVELNSNQEESESFKSYSSSDLGKASRKEVVEQLNNSGLWTSFKTRPFSKIPSLDSQPNSIFVTAMDSNPLASCASLVIDQHKEDFETGLKVLTHLTEGKIWLCHETGKKIPGKGIDRVFIQAFSGPHPSGLAGTHIHHLDPVHADKTVWTIGYQDIIAIGHLFSEGKPFVERVVSLAGPMVKKPRLIKTRMGACISELVKDELHDDGEPRVISGSVLYGHQAQHPFCFLGKFHNIISVLKEGRDREFLGWMSPGFEKFSVKNVFATYFMKNKRFPFTTNTNGSDRALVPVGSFEKVMPLDIVPTFLIRALLSHDTDSAQDLGALELDEEDVALMTFVCPGKTDYGPLLREALTTIEKEG